MTPFQTLVALRTAYPTPMSAAQLGELLNAVAWTHRAEGWGLFRKPNGAHCPQPQTGIAISRDILVNQTARIYVDVLIDAEGIAKATWGVKDDLTPDRSRFVAPVDPEKVVPLPPEPPSVPPPPPVQAQPYPGDQVGRAIGAALWSDFAAAGQAPNPDMVMWAWRASWDCSNPPYLTVEQSIKKHREGPDGWLRALGL